MIKAKNIYFASDLHFGTPNYQSSFQREKNFIAWLDTIQQQCSELFLVGDIFDFWFDYNKVVPKGFVRLLAKLASFSDQGIPVHYFKGNHDMWLCDYFEKELGFIIHDDNYYFEKEGQKFLVGHGDGKGPGDLKYKLLKKIFRNPICQFCFKWIHPDIGMALAHYWSNRSRYGGVVTEEKFLGEEREWLIQYSKKKHQELGANYYIFGHRHLALDINIDTNAKYINLGDWFSQQTYAMFDGQALHLLKYTSS
ncbi:MAG: UDP-2,3-diacylglucosamine diphosphatase [Chitinophagales bacterium]